MSNVDEGSEGSLSCLWWVLIILLGIVILGAIAAAELLFIQAAGV